MGACILKCCARGVCVPSNQCFWGVRWLWQTVTRLELKPFNKYLQLDIHKLPVRLLQYIYIFFVQKSQNHNRLNDCRQKRATLALV